MRKIKRLLAIFLTVLLTVGMSLGFVACRPYPWEIEEQRIFDEINQIEKNSNYALINDWEYRSADRAVVWKDLITEKIQADGKKQETSTCYTDLYLKEPNTTNGGFVAFAYSYDSEFAWFGLNKNTKKYAIGTISLADYSFKIHYLKLPYSKFYVVQTSETHFCCSAEDGETTSYVLVNRESGKIEKKWDNFESVKEHFTNGINQVYNRDTYTEDGIVYNVYRSCLESEDGVRINPPSYEYVQEKSEEMQRIQSIAGASDSTVDCVFITNGTELFVVFNYSQGMLGALSHLAPVVFRCDTSFETFEYIGCVSHVSTYNLVNTSICRLN